MLPSQLAISLLNRMAQLLFSYKINISDMDSEIFIHFFYGLYLFFEMKFGFTRFESSLIINAVADSIPWYCESNLP